MKLLLENWREFVKQEVEEFMPHGEVRAVERIGSSTLSPEEQAEQDLEKYGYVRDEGDRDFDIEVQIAGVSNEDVEEWAFSEEAEELENSYNYDVQLRIVENWRKYVSENEKTQDYGYLYLFEESGMRKVSFYDSLNVLNEDDSKIDIFLENWEKSIEYELQQLDEGLISDTLFNLSVKAFLLIDRLKDKVAKHAVKILKFVSKIHSAVQRFKKKHPRIYKVGAFAIKLIVVIVVLYVIQSMMGGSDAEAGNLVGTGIGGSYDPSGVAASEGELNFIAEALQEAGEPELAQKILKIVENPDDVQNFKGVGMDVKRIISDGIENMRIHGTEVDGAGELIDKAQEVVNSLPELTQQPDLVTGKALIPDGGVTQDLVAAADKLALNKIDGAGEVFKRVERDGYIYSIARPQ